MKLILISFLLFSCGKNNNISGPVDIKRPELFSKKDHYPIELEHINLDIQIPNKRSKIFTLTKKNMSMNPIVFFDYQFNGYSSEFREIFNNDTTLELQSFINNMTEDIVTLEIDLDTKWSRTMSIKDIDFDLYFGPLKLISIQSHQNIQKERFQLKIQKEFIKNNQDRLWPLSIRLKKISTNQGEYINDLALYIININGEYQYFEANKNFINGLRQIDSDIQFNEKQDQIVSFLDFFNFDTQHTQWSIKERHKNYFLSYGQSAPIKREITLKRHMNASVNDEFIDIPQDSILEFNIKQSQRTINNVEKVHRTNCIPRCDLSDHKSYDYYLNTLKKEASSSSNIDIEDLINNIKINGMSLKQQQITNPYSYQRGDQKSYIIQIRLSSGVHKINWETNPNAHYLKLGYAGGRVPLSKSELLNTWEHPLLQNETVSFSLKYKPIEE